jgi:hypothetical protein
MEGMIENNDTFNKKLDSWNVNKVGNFKNMFKDASSFDGAGTGRWRPGSDESVEEIDFEGMFQGALKYNSFVDTWKTKVNGVSPMQKVTSLKNMFNGATALDKDIWWGYDLQDSTKLDNVENFLANTTVDNPSLQSFGSSVVGKTGVTTIFANSTAKSNATNVVINEQGELTNSGPAAPSGGSGGSSAGNSGAAGETDDTQTLQSFYITKVPSGVPDRNKFIGGPYVRIDDNTYGWSGGEPLTYNNITYSGIKYVRRASSPYEMVGQGYYVPGSETRPAPWDSEIQINVASNAWASASTPGAVYGNRFHKDPWYWYLPKISQTGYGSGSRNIFRKDIDGEEGEVTEGNPDFAFDTFVYE